MLTVFTSLRSLVSFADSITDYHLTLPTSLRRLVLVNHARLWNGRNLQSTEALDQILDSVRSLGHTLVNLTELATVTKLGRLFACESLRSLDRSEHRGSNLSFRHVSMQ